MLAEIGTCLVSIYSGDANASVIREATSEARAGSQFGSTMTNSSPLETSHQVRRLDAGMQPFCKLDQHRVAGGMSERIVDVLEIVEVEE